MVGCLNNPCGRDAFVWRGKVLGRFIEQLVAVVRSQELQCGFHDSQRSRRIPTPPYLVLVIAKLVYIIRYIVGIFSALQVAPAIQAGALEAEDQVHRQEKQEDASHCQNK